MAASTQSRNTPRRVGNVFGRPMEAATKIYAGTIVCLNAAGNAVPGSVSTTLTAEGISEHDQDNSLGAAGAIIIGVRPGIYQFDNSASGDLIAAANINANCYIVDDHTVALTNGSNTRSIAGVIRDVDAKGVWVAIGKPPFPL